MAVVDIIEFLLMALEVTGKFKGKNFHLQKKDESFTWRSSYSWSYVYFLQCSQSPIPPNPSQPPWESFKEAS